eukprot:jgi/Mesvir1/21680/Mv04101-RA.1
MSVSCAARCTQDCQKADYPAHKPLCKKLADRGDMTAEEMAETVTDGQAQHLVRIAGEELATRFSTNSPLMPPGAASQIYEDRVDGMPALDAMDGSAVCAVQVLSVRSPENERTLGRAGACALFVDALARTLAGRCWIPLFYTCTGLTGLISTSQKNRGVVARCGGIEHLTRAMAGAAQRRAWRNMEVTNYCLYSLADETSNCPRFAAAGTMAAVTQCIVAGASAQEGADASFAGCGNLASLLRLMHACKDPQCTHRSRNAVDPALLPALDTCLDAVLNVNSEGSNLHHVAQAIAAVITHVECEPLGLPSEGALRGAAAAMATPRLSQNIVRACQLAVSPSFLAVGRLYDTHWTLASSLCRVISSLCRDASSGIAGKLRPACPLVVKMLRIANTEGFDRVSRAACLAVEALSADASNRKRLVAEGAFELVVGAVRQQLARLDPAVHAHVFQMVNSLSAEVAEGGSTGPLARDVCKLAVDTIKLLLASGGQGTAEVGVVSPARRAAGLAGYWGRMIAAIPACRQHLMGAGAREVLGQAIEVADAEGDVDSASLLRAVRKESLVSTAAAGASKSSAVKS